MKPMSVQNKIIFLILFLPICFLCCRLAICGEMAFVRVQDSNNPECHLIHAGQINYDFEIAVNETTNQEYCDFLNSVAKFSDPFKLYSPLMQAHFWGGIIKKEDDTGSSIYYCKEGYGSYPVVFVSWYDATRFVNWLHYGKPTKGITVIGTTEGNRQWGAYNTKDFNNNVKSSVSARIRNPVAEYWLPNRNEWVKAGFYDGKGSYYNYATQSNSVPSSVSPLKEDLNAANYYSDHWAAPYPHLTETGAYWSSRSYYGTHDQAGNVMEWAENVFPGGSRMALGGSLFMYLYSLPITYWDGELPETKLSTFGFRVARKIDAMSKPYPFQINATAIQSMEEITSQEMNFQGMKFVKVSDPSNQSDYNGYGCVDYEYYIGKYEISNDQYTEFLNAVAVQGDPFELYCESMNQGVLGGIIRLGQEGAFYYKVKDGWGKKPVNYVSWFCIARLANWYHYQKPKMGVSKLCTTEGTSTIGSYDTTNYLDITPEGASFLAYRKKLITRNQGAQYFIPNEEEWYKAAYYDPEKLGIRKYWDYPVRTDNPPNNIKSPGNTYSCNYQNNSTYSEGPPFYLSDIDAYPLALSYYGTQCQGGNVWEWLENWRKDSGVKIWRGMEAVKAVRGGSFSYTATGLHVSNTDPADPRHKTYVHGARLAKCINEFGYSPTKKDLIKQIFSSLFDRGKRRIIISAFIGFISGTILTMLSVWSLKKLFLSKGTNICQVRNWCGSWANSSFSSSHSDRNYS